MVDGQIVLSDDSDCQTAASLSGCVSAPRVRGCTWGSSGREVEAFVPELIQAKVVDAVSGLPVRDDFSEDDRLQAVVSTKGGQLLIELPLRFAGSGYNRNESSLAFLSESDEVSATLNAPTERGLEGGWVGIGNQRQPQAYTGLLWFSVYDDQDTFYWGAVPLPEETWLRQ